MARLDVDRESPAAPEGLTVADLGEFGLLERLGLEGRRFRSGWVGPGDDAAVIPSPENPVAVTSDLLLEGIHFRQRTSTPEEIGYKALAVNLSDLAAMGARPMACTLSVALPPTTEVRWVERLYAGMGEAARIYGCPLVGGDTSSAPTLFLSLTLLGECARRGPVLRSTAHAGEDVFLSGCTGESAAGLCVLERGEDREDPDYAPLVRRHTRPTPQLALGRELARRGIASAMIDVSDGLAQDAGHIARLSRVGIRLRANLLPHSPTLERAASRLGLDPLLLAFSGGEDYELLFTAPPDRRQAVLDTAAMTGCEVTRIGETVAGAGAEAVDASGASLPLERRGFNHFR